jgi:hypothetical protein
MLRSSATLLITGGASFIYDFSDDDVDKALILALVLALRFIFKM